MTLKSKPANGTLDHLMYHGRIYLPILVIVLGLILTFVNFNFDKPTLVGEETYYHLAKADNNGRGFYFLLQQIQQLISDKWLVVIPLLMSSLIIFLGYTLCEKYNTSQRISFFFFLFIIISPAFLLNSISISAYSLFLLLTVLAFVLLNSQKRFWKMVSLFPFLLAAGVDLASGILLLALLLIHIYSQKPETRKMSWGIFIITVLAIMAQVIFLTLPKIIGPFHLQSVFPDLISDLGGVSGVSFFILLLALIGIAIAWKQKQFKRTYLLLFIVIPVYILNTSFILPLAILASFFAMIAFLALLERTWTLEILKKFTILILLLGILFSAMTFGARIVQKTPLNTDQNVLSWIKLNLPSSGKVFSTPENGYYINYFAGKEAITHHHQNNPVSMNLTNSIFKAGYITDLFPLLENNNITVIYLTPKMREQLPSDQGLLFLLKNERFKMVYSYDKTEVWIFT